MEYIIHLTNKCTFDNIKALIDYEISRKEKYSIIVFYGGEPLLQKNMIKDTIDYIKSKKSKTKFYYGITTNGTLLDDEFIQFMKDNRFVVNGYSIDGIKGSHDLNRKTVEGEETFDIVEKNAKKMLNSLDSLVSMTVITRNNLPYLSKNIEFLINMNFKKINLLIDYLQDWQDEDLDLIKDQINKMADIYAEAILKENDVEISLLDDKIRSYINDNYDCNCDCHYAVDDINVGTDGNFYPCMQFVDNPQYVIGNCKDGINNKARVELLKNSKKENEICKKCAIRKRCKHLCSCRNYMLTKDVNELSPVICETEKILIEAADRIAEKLYKQNSKMFIQRFYNKKYDLLKELVKKYDKE